ncbi:unnamed protein product [Parnassius apollo]|uniref:(apollo) hypothetical protein n=1 Tax=Parnassius apollo TaxID=110799 RepID=A0A8S3XZ38_PARAO|nr:unnamed protein product [Parnassius apollo]
MQTPDSSVTNVHLNTAYLNDDDIENELEQIFGLPDNPDESEDEYEGEDSLEIGLGVPNIENSDSEGEEILRSVRPSQVSRTISESSTDSSSHDENENDWKKGSMWPDRPNADKYDEVTLKPKVFFPSRTSPMAYFSRYFSEEVIDLIIEQTNLYASQKGDFTLGTG